jgi:hypothetical protein
MTERSATGKAGGAHGRICEGLLPNVSPPPGYLDAPSIIPSLQSEIVKIQDPEKISLLTSPIIADENILSTFADPEADTTTLSVVNPVLWP